MLDGWKTFELSDIVCRDRPITYGIVQPGDFVSSGIPMIRSGDYSDGWVSPCEVVHVSKEIARPYERSKVRAGDILMTVVGANTGTVVRVPNHLDCANISRASARLAVDRKQICPDYVEQFMKSAFWTKQIYSSLKAGAQPVVHLSDLGRFKLHAPQTLPEQRKIAEILRTWDEAIDACERLIARLEKRQVGLVSQLVFGARRLANFATTSEMEKHRWFELPTDWNVEPIGMLADERSEFNGGNGDAEVLSCSKYDGFVRSLEYFKKQVFSSDLSTYKNIRRGDFGFPSNHVEEGSIGLQGLVDVGVVSPIYTVFCFDPARVDNDYAFNVLKTEVYRHIFQVSTSASVDRRGSLRWSEFSKIPFPLPSLNEQRAISSVIADGRSEIAAARSQRDALANQKRGLMQKLLTGEWRVNV